MSRKLNIEITQTETGSFVWELIEGGVVRYRGLEYTRAEAQRRASELQGRINAGVTDEDMHPEPMNRCQ